MITRKFERQVLRERRISNGITQKFIASKLGYSQSTPYYNIEKGTKNPTVGEALVIAEILGRTVEELFFEDKLLIYRKVRELNTN